MLTLYIIVAVSLLALVVVGVVEQRRHLANLERIPVRILVNGSRGKSSVTRLCAGALRGGGVRAVAKTTGTAPRLIWPDATEEPVTRRFDIPNVIETIRVVRKVVAADPVALVAECMAVDPDLQELNQTRLIRSGIGVLTNVRQDHLDEMGPTLRHVARSLARSMPRDGVCITAATTARRVLEQEARRRNCRLVHADPESVSDRELSYFPPFTFKENVAIALAVAAELGVPRDLALLGMWDAPPDPGALTVACYDVAAAGGPAKRLRMANVFAANDPSSTLLNVQRLLDEKLIRPPLFTLINCRPDRIDRNGQMGSLVPHWQTEKLFVIGHPTRSALLSVPRHWQGEVVDLGGPRRPVDEIVGSLVDHIGGEEASVVAIGNIHGHGEQLLDHLGRLAEGSAA